LLAGVYRALMPCPTTKALDAILHVGLSFFSPGEGKAVSGLFRSGEERQRNFALAGKERKKRIFPIAQQADA